MATALQRLVSAVMFHASKTSYQNINVALIELIHTYTHTKAHTQVNHLRSLVYFRFNIGLLDNIVAKCESSEFSFFSIIFYYLYLFER